MFLVKPESYKNRNLFQGILCKAFVIDPIWKPSAYYNRWKMEYFVAF